MPRTIIKQRKRTVVCKDCNKTVSDLTWKELEAQGWDVAVPMWAQSREGLGKEGYYVKYPQNGELSPLRHIAHSRFRHGCYQICHIGVNPHAETRMLEQGTRNAVPCSRPHPRLL
jgi:hypothetical protein